jgi:thiamine biosynthesis lipoprotein
MTQPSGFPLHRYSFRAMGSPCELQLCMDEQQALHLAGRARAEIERLEQRYSRYRENSLLSRINRVAASGGRIGVDAETASLLDYANQCHQESDGLFDISSGLLRRAWRFDTAVLPSQESIAPLLARVGWGKIRWASPVLEIPAGMELDLGGIVKEYAADRVATLLTEAGCPSAMVNLGGDIRVTAPRPDGSAWQIGIRDPRGTPGAPLECIALERGAVATSGDYERCIVIGDTRYGHLLDPRTGWPVRHLASVTVVADFCVLAGSASTIAMLRAEHGPAWLAELQLPHLWIDVRGRRGGTMTQSGM